MSSKKHIKPGLYAMYYWAMKTIAEEYGYNLLINGSMARDLDLVAVPWIDNPRPEQDLIFELQEYLTGKTERGPKGKAHYTILPGGRHSYVIDLNRGDRFGEWTRFADEQYYIDISITQI